MRLTIAHALPFAIATLSGGSGATSAWAPKSNDARILRTNVRVLSRGGARKTLVMPGFTCVDTENGSVCKGNTKSCTDDGACAYTELTQVLDGQGSIRTIRTCNRWDPDPTGARRDGCITDTMDGFDIVSCVAEFEDETGTMAACNSCSRSCGDGVGASMDCTNVVPNKEPYTCELLDLTDGGSLNFNSVPAPSPTAPAPSPTMTAPTPTGAGPTLDAPTPEASNESTEPEEPAPSQSAPDSGSVQCSTTYVASAVLGLIVIALL
jgi:hypothetical protein